MQVPLDDTATGAEGPEQFEELELTTGEIARLVVPVDAAECVYVHTMESPVVIDGEPQYETRHRKDKSEYKVPQTAFVGRRQCLGDPEYQRDHGGIDERQCPACAAAADGIPELVPERRYALPVIRVATKSKTSTDVQDPPGAKILVLRLTARQYGELGKNLKNIRELHDWPPEHPVRPIHADLILECEDADWRRLKWNPPMRPSWTKTKNPALNAFITALWGNVDNRPTVEQLQLACARPADRRWLDIDVGKVVDGWAEWRSAERGGKPERRGGQPAEHAQAGGLSEGADELEALLGTEAPADAKPEPAQASQDPDPDLAGLDVFADPAEPAHANGDGKPAAAAEPDPADDPLAEPAETKPAETKPAAPDGKVESFDDVLEGL